MTALQELMLQIAKEARKKAHKIRFVCDSDNRADFYQQVHANFRKVNPETASKTASTLEFTDDKYMCGIQAADLTAHELNRVHQEYGLGIRERPLPERLSRLQPFMYICDYQRLLSVLDGQTSDEST